MIKARALEKRYGDKRILRGVVLDVTVDDFLLVTGPNGAGKTTLLQLAIGLVRASAGSVHVLGLSPRDDAAALLPCVGFVAQEHPLYRRLTGSPPQLPTPAPARSSPMKG